MCLICGAQLTLHFALLDEFSVLPYLNHGNLTIIPNIKITKWGDRMKKIFSLLLISLILAAVIIGSGVYNIAATEKHWPVTEKLIEWMRISSVNAHVKSMEVPSLDSTDMDMIVTGATHYHAMCTGCHLAPGMKPTELSIGLYPQAPVFYQREATIDPAKALEQMRAYFWVIKNGIKMTAMPAWGLSHDDATIWAMVAFISRMSGLTHAHHQALTHSTQGSVSAHDHHDHSHE